VRVRIGAQQVIALYHGWCSVSNRLETTMMQPNGSTGPSNMSQGMVLNEIEDSDRENEVPCVGVGVVRIHSFCLKLKTINRDRYWKTANHQNNV
jgi:hypothetical protein